MSSLPWEERTILTFSADFNFEAQPIFEQSNDGLRDEPSNPKSQRKPRLSAANVWNFLLSLTDNGASGLTAEAGKLKHFQAKDFDNTWDHTATTLGEGTSYTVEKWTLENPPEKGYSSSEEKAVVAVKRLNTFKSGSSEDSPIDSVTLQYSISTVLKELRILTHPPLQHHRNIATLLGYRSEFVRAATSTEQPQEQQRSTDIALVAEFAQYGTLSEFVAQRGDFDLLTKARFMHDLASGLAALHECGIAHGDVKLDNTLVFEDHFKGYIAKLSDFGHALVDLDNDEDNLTIATPEKHQWYLGTPLFNAPEIRPRGPLSNAPARTLMRATGFFKCDIFSYGVLVWELLLNGIRFTSSFDIEGSSIATTGGFDQDLDKLWNFLSALPKDEFLRKALSCLEAGISHGKDEGALVGTLRQVLEATLRDLPWERKSSEKVVNIFRELKTFRDDDTR
jgi:serine/threonine protein kinase